MPEPGNYSACMYTAQANGQDTDLDVVLVGLGNMAVVPPRWLSLSHDAIISEDHDAL